MQGMQLTVPMCILAGSYTEGWDTQACDLLTLALAALPPVLLCLQQRHQCNTGLKVLNLQAPVKPTPGSEQGGQGWGTGNADPGHLG